MERFLTSVLGPKWRRRLLMIGALVVLLWVAFFDSHSLLKRWQLHVENRELIEKNDGLGEQIEKLEDDLEQVESDETVERVAREQYGMRKEGETVHRVEDEKQERR